MENCKNILHRSRLTGRQMLNIGLLLTATFLLLRFFVGESDLPLIHFAMGFLGSLGIVFEVAGVIRMNKEKQAK